MCDWYVHAKFYGAPTRAHRDRAKKEAQRLVSQILFCGFVVRVQDKCNWTTNQTCSDSLWPCLGEVCNRGKAARARQSALTRT